MPQPGGRLSGTCVRRSTGSLCASLIGANEASRSSGGRTMIFEDTRGRAPTPLTDSSTLKTNAPGREGGARSKAGETRRTTVNTHRITGVIAPYAIETRQGRSGLLVL